MLLNWWCAKNTPGTALSLSLSRFLFFASKLSHSTFHYWVLIIKEDKQDIPSTVVWMHKQHHIHAIQHTSSGVYTDKHRLRLKGASAKFRLAADEGEGQTRLISKVNESLTVRGETQAIKIKIEGHSNAKKGGEKTKHLKLAKLYSPNEMCPLNVCMLNWSNWFIRCLIAEGLFVNSGYQGRVTGFRKSRFRLWIMSVEGKLDSVSDGP